MSEIAAGQIGGSEPPPSGQNEPMTSPATTPAPPYYAVIFTSRRNEQPDDGYAETFERMFALAQEQPGYLGYESARADGFGITVSYWATEDAIRSVEGEDRARRRATRGHATAGTTRTSSASRASTAPTGSSARDPGAVGAARADQARRRPRAATGAHQRRGRGRARRS